jgi:hypothetical protein
LEVRRGGVAGFVAEDLVARDLITGIFFYVREAWSVGGIGKGGGESAAGVVLRIESLDCISRSKGRYDTDTPTPHHTLE